MQADFRMEGLDELQSLIVKQLQQVKPRATRAFLEIGVRWVYEAKRRVPVDTGLLRNTINKEQGWDGDGPWVRVGSNQKYAKYVEFGTDRIAGGAVKALGTSEQLTDQQAIHDWPAKRGDASKMTSVKIDSKGRLRRADGRFVGGPGGAQEQMPWLRPSLMAIRDWVIKKIAGIFSFE